MKRADHVPILAAAALLLALVLTSGCAATRPSTVMGEAQIAAKIASLQGSLEGLGQGADPVEARRAAEAAVTRSLRLAEEYRVVPPARWHNLLIQMGLRDRGLCYHWTEDLMAHLQALHLANYELHWGVAHPGSDLREHNSVVVTALNQPFEKGLVLDPWRNSGELTWVRVEEDAYPWQPLPRAKW
jgi:hypothetical protein